MPREGEPRKVPATGQAIRDGAIAARIRPAAHMPAGTSPGQAMSTGGAS